MAFTLIGNMIMSKQATKAAKLMTAADTLAKLKAENAALKAAKAAKPKAAKAANGKANGHATTPNRKTISAVAIAVELGYSDKTCRAYLRRHEALLPHKPLANMPSRWHWDIKHKAAITAFLRDGAFA
jgi:hypothetical protein